jgi:hypothetical protein
MAMPETESAEWDELKREFNAACQQSAQSARVQIAHEMNQLLRRFRQYENEADWVRLVMEGAGNYARQAALFSVQGEVLVLRGAVNLTLAEDLRMEAKSAAAFEAVLRSKEAVTALCTSGEVGAPLCSVGRLAYLFPILNGARVAAVLFANGEDSEVEQLELVANMAASALERQTNSGLHAQIAVAPVAVAAAPVGVLEEEPVEQERRLPPWANLPAEHRALHSQAARYARVTVAEMQLLKPAACRTAGEKGDLYVVLGKEIDKARETYRQRFMVLPSMTDYLHRELIGSILGGDSTKLGADYPGELA